MTKTKKPTAATAPKELKHYTLPPDVIEQLQQWNATIEKNREGSFRGPKFGESRIVTGIVRWAHHHSIDLRAARTVEDIAKAPQRKRER